MTRSKTRYSGKTTRKADAEQRCAKVAALKQQLAAWEESTDPDEVARVVAHFTGYGRDYSPRNAKLIVAQRPDATDVAGFREWMLRGRVVRKGEHGIKILAPSWSGRAAGTEDSDDVQADNDQGDKEDMRFVFVTVFDISQTDPMGDSEK